MRSKFRLDEVTTITMGQAPPGDSYNTEQQGWPLIAGAGDFHDGKAKVSKFTTRPSKISNTGDIILGIRASIGEKVTSDGEYCLGRGVAGIRPSSKVNPSFLWHWLTHNTRNLAAKGKGATFKQVNRKDIGELEIELPSLEEQTLLSKAIDSVESAREARRRSIELLDELAQSIFLDMFGDPADGWPSLTVQDVAESTKNSIRTGPFGSQLLRDEFVEQGIRVLGIDNAVDNEFKWGKPRFITEQKYQQLSRYTVSPGDLLITIMGTCGRCAVVPEGIPTAINTKHLCCITLDRQKCLPEFLHSYFLMHPTAQSYLRQTAKGAIMSGLNMGIIKKLPMLLPPLELQQKYVDKVTRVREQKKQHLTHLAHLDELFASVQQRAFDGTLWDDPTVTT